jgi:1,2-diacylglycerol 3-alpha-glucosyltransferase
MRKPDSPAEVPPLRPAEPYLSDRRNEMSLCMRSIAVLWAQYGPYHFARVAALKSHAESQTIHALEIASETADYQWSRSGSTVNLITLCPGALAERSSFWYVFFRSRQCFAKLKLDVCFVPSFSPKQSMAALFAARSLGIRTVMMCDSHAGTARKGIVNTWLKRRLTRMFDAALVAGNPQRRYVESLGLPPENIFVGYDAVDNDYFARRANDIRAQAPRIRNSYDLPQRYFLSLGRFLAKKNLATLIRSFRRFLDARSRANTHLVLVGSGAEDTNLRLLCDELRLPVYNKMAMTIDNRESSTGNSPPGVHFYGFRQIDENSIFYALADAFILPSSSEEWGLVVNEAMSCGLPVVVSEAAGCAEDLLRKGGPAAAESPHKWEPKLASCVRQNGFVFDPRSVTALADTLLVLDADPVLREKMGEASQSIIQDFSCEKFARNALLAAQTAMPVGLSAPRDLSSLDKK